jgi:hypothetical protein
MYTSLTKLIGYLASMIMLIALCGHAYNGEGAVTSAIIMVIYLLPFFNRRVNEDDVTITSANQLATAFLAGALAPLRIPYDVITVLVKAVNWLRTLDA